MKEITSNGSDVVITGDLNYRTTDLKEPSKEEQQLITERTCSCLSNSCDKNSQTKINEDLKNDQLRKNLLTLKLKEPLIKFCHTCKLKLRNSLIDRTTQPKQYDQERGPSWCDRVLTGFNQFFKPIKGEYDAIDLTSLSDHLAVYQVLEAELSRYNLVD